MGFIYFIHVSACILLVIAVLMQAGRGGGLTETFSSAESMFGTQTNVFMVRLTVIFAAVFLCTSLILAVGSSKGEQSLMGNQKLLSSAPKPAPAPPKDEGVQVKVESPKPMAAPETAATTTNTEVPAGPVTNAAK